MFPLKSPEGRAFRRARQIDFNQVRDRADHAADEAAYGLSLPVEREAWLTRISELAEQGHDRDGSAWQETWDRTYARECFPEEHIAQWFREAGVTDPAAAAQATAREIGLTCQLYYDERRAEGLRWKVYPQPTHVDRPARRSAGRRPRKASGLGNLELRDAVKKASAAARQLAGALHTLRDEALRPGQAGTGRGARVRALYTGAIATLLAEVARAQRLDSAAAEMLELIAARIDVEGDSYASAHLPWEAGLTSLARWLERRADDDRFWNGLDAAHGTVTGARDRLIGRLGSLFHRATGVQPTCRGQPKRSPFLRFMAAAHGHMTGLVYARIVDDETARRSVEAQGLGQVFSAPVYRAALLAHKSSSPE